MPQRWLVIGNSGSGKSTLARELARAHELAHLDLDSVAWEPAQPLTRRAIADSLADIRGFMAERPRWVIEGCYADLLEPLLAHADALRFLNPDVEVCVAHCRARPWEPHKYASKAEQDRNLEFLLNWVREYPTRGGPLGLAAHRALFEAFTGDKLELS
jgi:adenylate kinase family enzyme